MTIIEKEKEQSSKMKRQGPEWGDKPSAGKRCKIQNVQ
jgi:hypothetical protein